MSNEKINHFPKDPGKALMSTAGNRVRLVTDGTASAPFNVANLPFNGASGTTQLPAAFAWLRSIVVNVTDIRHLSVEVLYNGNASGSVGQVQVLPFYCKQYTAPLTTDDVWDNFTDSDGSLTLAALAAGTLPTSSNITTTTTYAVKKLNPVVFLGPAATGASNKARIAFELNVESATYVMFYVREIGETTNSGVVDLWYCGSN